MTDAAPRGWERLVSRWPLLARVRRELGSLIALAVAAGGVFAFLRIAGEMREGDTRAFDSAILLALRNPADLSDPIGPRWLEIAMRDVTSLGSVTVLTMVTVAAVAYLLIDGRRGAALLVAVAVGGGTVLSTLLKLGFERPRPDLVSHLVDVTDMSFPSGHAMLSAVTYLTLGALLARTAARRRQKVFVVVAAILLTVLVGSSRVYLGVHWPTDVLAGWALGAGWSIGCWAIANALQGSGTVEQGPQT